jgi:hypothetical protein
VLDVPIKEGSSVIEANTFNEGTTIATLADMSQLIFEGKVDESEVGKLKPGMAIVLTIGALEPAKFNAVLEHIAPKGIEENGAIQFKIRAAVEPPKDDPGMIIRANYSANADIVLDQREKVLALKESLVQFEGRQRVRRGRDGPQKFEKRQIKTGLSDGVSIEVVDGLKKEDKVKAGAQGGPPTAGACDAGRSAGRRFRLARLSVATGRSAVGNVPEPGVFRVRRRVLLWHVPCPCHQARDQGARAMHIRNLLLCSAAVSLACALGTRARRTTTHTRFQGMDQLSRRTASLPDEWRGQRQNVVRVHDRNGDGVSLTDQEMSRH